MKYEGSQHESPTGLFSPLPTSRLQAAHELNPDGIAELPAKWNEAVKEWPMFNAGALNSWLLFIGVSPGDSTPAGVDLTAQHWLPTLGIRHPFAGHYCDDAGFWQKVRGLTEHTLSGFLPSGADPLELFMVANFAGDLNAAPTIKDMENAVRLGEMHVKRTLLLTQARLICVMKKSLAVKVIDMMQAWGWPAKELESVDVGSRCRARVWQIDTPYGTAQVTQSGQHPSMYIPVSLPNHLRNLASKIIADGSSGSH